MELLSISRALQVHDRELICFYGGGGKTSLLFRLARELSSPGSKVLLTTTTRMSAPQSIPCVFASGSAEAARKLQESFQHYDMVMLGHHRLSGNKISGIDPYLVEELYHQEEISYILVEADGAAHKPIKGYASYEPVLPPGATLNMPLLGVDAVGKRINTENVHRPALFARQAGAEGESIITVKHFARSLSWMEKVGRILSPSARFIPAVNKVDLLQNTELVRDIAASWAKMSSADRLCFLAAVEEVPLKFIFIPGSKGARPFVSCVILAAGLSSRMGMNKLALSVRGKTMLEHTVDNALKSYVDEVIVVARPDSCDRPELEARPRLKVVDNPFYRQGISSSLKAGLQAVSSLSQGVFFTPGDQPFIYPENYNLLLEHYRESQKLVTFPQYRGKRGNPALFDRRTWPLLLELGGDIGGRAIFSRLPEGEICGLETSQKGVIMDFDTPEDLEKR